MKAETAAIARPLAATGSNDATTVGNLIGLATLFTSAGLAALVLSMARRRRIAAAAQ